MSIPPSPKSRRGKLSTDPLATQMLQAKEVHYNMEQTIVVITEDKIRLCLSDHLADMEKRRDWIAPFAVCVALVTALTTTTFRDMGLSKDTWQAVFVIATTISFGWFLFALRHLFGKHAITVDDVITEMKTGAVARQTMRSEVTVTPDPGNPTTDQGSWAKPK